TRPDAAHQAESHRLPRHGWPTPPAAIWEPTLRKTILVSDRLAANVPAPTCAVPSDTGMAAPLSPCGLYVPSKTVPPRQSRRGAAASSYLRRLGGTRMSRVSPIGSRS